MGFTYENIRNMYYFGILCLIMYGLPKIDLLNQYVRPLLDYEVITGLPVISFIALGTAFGAFLGYKYRRIG